MNLMVDNRNSAQVGFVHQVQMAETAARHQRLSLAPEVAESAFQRAGLFSKSSQGKRNLPHDEDYVDFEEFDEEEEDSDCAFLDQLIKNFSA